jgi:CheY-like chemotaxis protein
MTERERTNYDKAPMNILYIEDDHDDQEIFQEVLTNVAPRTVCYLAGDADEARELLNEIHINPDYIFLDINIPGTDGISFLREIKESEALKSIPVIVYSTTNNRKYALQCKRLGALEFITKPSTFQGVCNILKKYCSSKRSTVAL